MSKPVRIQRDTQYEGMYRLKWADNVLSEDMYNKTRANDILASYDEYVKYMSMRGNKRARI